MGCDTVQSCKWIPTFRRNMLPPSFGLKRVKFEDESSILLRRIGIHLQDKVSQYKRPEYGQSQTVIATRPSWTLLCHRISLWCQCLLRCCWLRIFRVRSYASPTHPELYNNTWVGVPSWFWITFHCAAIWKKVEKHWSQRESCWVARYKCSFLLVIALRTNGCRRR
jgi:hypothetical protein